MRISKLLGILSVFVLVFLLQGCAGTTGAIRGNQFYLEGNFAVDLLNEDWEIVRQKYDLGIASSPFEIAFVHKKSNGEIGINSFKLDEVFKARSLEVVADEAVARWSGIKLSQKFIKISGNDAVEIVISGHYMVKLIFLKKKDSGYWLLYKNTPTYFDEYLEVFDKFVKKFITL